MQNRLNGGKGTKKKKGQGQSTTHVFYINTGNVY